jgi:hypothetical protein
MCKPDISDSKSSQSGPRYAAGRVAHHYPSVHMRLMKQRSHGAFRASPEPAALSSAVMGIASELIRIGSTRCILSYIYNVWELQSRSYAEHCALISNMSGAVAVLCKVWHNASINKALYYDIYISDLPRTEITESFSGRSHRCCMTSLAIVVWLC